MKTFEFTRPADVGAAVAAGAKSRTAQQGADVRFVAGGTTLIDLMKLNVETPARVVDINHLPLNKVEVSPDGGLKIGATVRNQGRSLIFTECNFVPAAGAAIAVHATATWAVVPSISVGA